MLQLIAGLPLKQWPEPSRDSSTVVNPAPVTANVPGTNTTIAVARAAARTVSPAADRRLGLLLIALPPCPPPTESMGAHAGGCRRVHGQPQSLKGRAGGA